VIYAPHSGRLWIALTLIGLAAAAHQAWSANLFTLTSDMFPRRAVGSVVGIGGFGGAVGGVIIQIVTGHVVQLTHSYAPMFVVAGLVYLAALLAIHSLAPKLEPAQLE
jgi:ACS family hexuronate transporter-like MFS transporter